MSKPTHLHVTQHLSTCQLTSAVLLVHTLQDSFVIVWEKVADILQLILTGIKAVSNAFKHREIDDCWMLATGRNMASLAPSIISSCLTMWDARAFQSHHSAQESIPVIELSIMFTIAWAARGANASLSLECTEQQLESLITDAFRAASMQQIPSQGQLWESCIHPSSSSWTTWDHVLRTQPPVTASDTVSQSDDLLLYILQPSHVCLQHIIGAVTDSGGSAVVEAASQPAIDVAWHTLNNHKLPMSQGNMIQWVSTGCSSSMKVNHIRVRSSLLHSLHRNVCFSLIATHRERERVYHQTGMLW